MPHKSLIFLITVLLIACTFNNDYINRQEDRDEALKVTNELYRLIKIQQFEKTSKLFSKEFLEATDKDKVVSMLKTVNFRQGRLKTTSLDTWQTQVRTGSNPQSNYLLIFKNQYESFLATETIRLTKEKGEIKIITYNVDSPAFKIPTTN